MVDPRDGSDPAERQQRLAPTPPMGWNSWNQVGCYELTEQVVRDAADALVTTGMRDAGYHYVVVDDCWQAHTRGPSGELRAHPDRFPSGIAALSDYVHARGLKFGIYACPGKQTCMMLFKYPGVDLGSIGHEQQDAETFASWGVDFLKYDWCNATANGLEPVSAYTAMRDALLATGRDIVYSISEYGEHKPWTWARPIANMWRTTPDLFATWESVSGVIDNQAELAQHSGQPGGWNDPDMLQIGNGALTEEENRTHFSFWAILNAPLFAGTDLTRLTDSSVAILTNPEVIAVNQDFAGSQARRISAAADHEVWGKPLSDGGHVVALYNKSDHPASVTTELARLELAEEGAEWGLRDLWAHRDVGRTRDVITADVPSHGVVLYRLSR